MKITRNNLLRLAKNCDHNPTEIGFVILKLLGYRVEKYYLSDAWYVHDKNNKLVAYDSGAYVD